MGGTSLLGGSWGPILQLDMENWIEFLEVLNLPYNILDFVQGPFLPDELLNVKRKWDLQKQFSNIVVQLQTCL